MSNDRAAISRMAEAFSSISRCSYPVAEYAAYGVWLAGQSSRLVRAGLRQSRERFGPDSFVHYSCAFYLLGCLAFLEGEDGSYSWDNPSASNSDFDTFLANNPAPPRDSYSSRGVSKVNMAALACIRNAVIHHRGDLAQNRDSNSLVIFTGAGIAGVTLNGSVITLEAPFHDFVRLSTLAVRNYPGEF